MSEFLKKVEGWVDKVQDLVKSHTGGAAKAGAEDEPDTSGARFTILLAALDGDADDSRRQALAKALKASGLFDTRMLPNLFELPWATASGREAPGRVDLATAQIQRNEADGLVWGRLVANGKAVRLGVIINGKSDVPLAYDLSDQLIPSPTGGFGAEQARLLVTSVVGATISRGDGEMAAALNRALQAAARALDSDENPLPERARTYGLLVQARGHLAAWRHDSNPRHLTEAMRCGGAAAAGLEHLRDEAGTAWAQCLVGVALTRMAGDSGDRDLQRQAVDAFRAALTIRNRKQRPLDWAYASLRLADALALAPETAEEAESLRDAAEAEIQRITGAHS